MHCPTLQYEAPTLPQPGAPTEPIAAAPATPTNRQLAEASDPSQTTEVTMPFLHVVSNEDTGNVHVELPGLNIKCAPTDHGTTKCTSARPFRTREVSISGSITSLCLPCVMALCAAHTWRSHSGVSELMWG
jgi:hypothetical protein